MVRRTMVEAAENEKASGLLEPLLDDEAISTSSEEWSEFSDSAGSAGGPASIQAEPSPMQVLKMTGVYVSLAAGAAASLGAIVMSPSVAVFVMAGMCMANIPYSAYKEYKIQNIPGRCPQVSTDVLLRTGFTTFPYPKALRAVSKKIREDAMKLEIEVENLAEEIVMLQPEATRAKAVEEELAKILDSQHGNIDKLIDLVKENNVILEEIKDNMRRRIMEDVLRIVMRSDKDNNGTFCKVETKMMVLKISLKLREYGVTFNEENFFAVMGDGPSMAKTLSIVKSLVPPMRTRLDDEDIGESDSEDDDDEIYAMFHMEGNEHILETNSCGCVLTENGKQNLSLSLKPVAPRMARRQSRAQ
ncbi:hypothetical protein ACHAWF_004101 [Thalassiosira exigua]